MLKLECLNVFRREGIYIHILPHSPFSMSRSSIEHWVNHKTLIAAVSCFKTDYAASAVICFCFWFVFLFLDGRTSPQLDSLTKGSTLKQAVKAPATAAPAPPAPVGQRSQTAAAAPRPISTSTGSQKPPDLLEQRKGKEICWACNCYISH